MRLAPGIVVHNPVSAEWARVLEASPDRVVAEVIAPPGAGVRTGAELLHAQVTVSPPLNFVGAVAATWGLCALGSARPDGSPGIRDAVLLAEAFSQDIELCSPPRWVRRAAAALVPLIRATGRAVDSPAVLQAAAVDPGRWPGPRAGMRPIGPLTTPTEV